MDNKCYIFLWNSIWDTKHHFCRECQTKTISLNEFRKLYHIFDAVLAIDAFPNIILQNHQELLVIKIRKMFNRIHLKHVHKKTSTNSGYTIYTYKRSKIEIGTILFHCKKGGYILQKYVCDENKDCPNDSSDEEFCICGSGSVKYDILKNNLCKVLKIN